LKKAQLRITISRLGYLFSTRQHMLSALYAIVRPSVCPSHSYGWISQNGWS